MRKPKGKTAAMSAVAKDIIAITIGAEDKLCDLVAKFHDVMRKHGIKQGDPCGNGRVISTWEWTGSWSLFLRCLVSGLEMSELMNDPPSDLQSYPRRGKK